MISPFVWRWAHALAADLRERRPKRRSYGAAYFFPYLLRRWHDAKLAALQATRLPESKRKEICAHRRRLCELMRECVGVETVDRMTTFIAVEMEDHLTCLGSSSLSGTTLPFLQAYYRINRAHRGLAELKSRERSIREHNEDVLAWEAGDTVQAIAGLRNHLITATALHVPQNTIISSEAASYERSFQSAHQMSRLIGPEIFGTIADSGGLYIWRGLELPIEFREVEQFLEQIRCALANGALLLYLPSSELHGSSEWSEAFERFIAAVIVLHCDGVRRRSVLGRSH